jgi:hypothetical protein
LRIAEYLSLASGNSRRQIRHHRHTENCPLIDREALGTGHQPDNQQQVKTNEFSHRERN